MEVDEALQREEGEEGVLYFLRACTLAISQIAAFDLDFDVDENLIFELTLHVEVSRVHA